ncbi:MAG: hypothetical protein A2902_07740 [Elusimicrobia bacterium RIFCSPLOWO2_01_FULL_64_13]|nr:MAG: hypothetical protein A2636_06660 [Elusimicrobia bacterium RIFCSPHIGHO2_01_FULL_64_10]OGR96944.1 MAG: hypothetical protein A2902_07740 [Elusimicrobia bacterium RIFCSPLOWO2_01_FULL_64_13]
MILPRFLTALVGVPLLVLAVWWGHIPFFVLIFGVVMLSLYEFYTLAGEADWPLSKFTGLLLGAGLIAAVYLFGTRTDWTRGWAGAAETALPAMLTGTILVLVLKPLFSRRDRESAFLNAGVTLIGLLYVVWTLSHLILIRDLRPLGREYTFFLLIVVWALDIGAYAGGSRFGRRKLHESVSPKKTWEGALAGTAAAVSAGLACRAAFLGTMGLRQAAGLALGLAVLAQLSDLTESLFKRNVRVKDSGSLLPGHGGILDRFDSFLLTSPVYYYVLVMFAGHSGAP